MSRILSLFLALVGLLQFVMIAVPNVSADAWQPQGRFGKRDGLDELKSALSGLQVPDNLRNVLLFNGRMQYADDPVIHGDGVVCIKTVYTGYYRCMRVINDQETFAHD